MIHRLATPDDAAAIAAIYAPYVTDTFVSFEAEAPDQAEMRRRIESGGALHPWLVAEADGRIAGFASASPFRPRAAYRFAVETSVYLDPAQHGRGLGRSLYERLLGLLERQGFAQAIGAISLPNEASVRLHEALGFARAGVYRQVGWKCGRWLDVGLWQRPLAPATVPPTEPKPFAEVWEP
ncbi:MAG TPA: arsinothricin resistance N-acetyltransferase ArsN1 family B [Allosphingosinicella sp.]|nr:arsinothricin resistance N-acetyltransferase ArsN1 family B [Allosphingosinicella sp.]